MRYAVALLLLAACGEGQPRGTANEVPVTMGGGIAPAPGVYPFQGTWAAAGEACAADPVRDPGGPTVITTRSLLDQGTRCDIVSVREDEGGAGTYVLAAECDQGASVRRTLARLRVDGDALVMAGRTLRRCEPTSANE